MAAAVPDRVVAARGALLAFLACSHTPSISLERPSLAFAGARGCYLESLAAPGRLTRFERRLGFPRLGLARAAAQVAAAVAGLVAAAGGALRAGDHRWVGGRTKTESEELGFGAERSSKLRTRTLLRCAWLGWGRG